MSNLFVSFIFEPFVCYNLCLQILKQMLKRFVSNRNPKLLMGRFNYILNLIETVESRFYFCWKKSTMEWITSSKMLKVFESTYFLTPWTLFLNNLSFIASDGMFLFDLVFSLRRLLFCRLSGHFKSCIFYILSVIINEFVTNASWKQLISICLHSVWYTFFIDCMT